MNKQQSCPVCYSKNRLVTDDPVMASCRPCRINLQYSESPSAARAAVAPSYSWLIVARVWFVCFFNHAERQSIYSVFPKLKEKFGFDKVQLGLVGPAFTSVAAGDSGLQPRQSRSQRALQFFQR